MVHQHFMLIPVMTVTENIVLANEPRHGAFMDMAEAERRVADLAQRYDLPVDPAARVEDIGVGMQQRAEILKALYRDARLLVLDEPTAVLTPQEALELFDVLRDLRSRGTAIILITHKLDEVLEIADRVSVLRRGVKVDTDSRRRRHRARPGRADGRPRGAARGGQDGGPARAIPCSRCETCTSPTTATWRPSAASR